MEDIQSLPERQAALMRLFGITFFLIASAGAVAVYFGVGLGIPYLRDPYVITAHLIGLANLGFYVLGRWQGGLWVRRAALIVPGLIIWAGIIATAHLPYANWAVFFLGVIPLVAAFTVPSRDVLVIMTFCLAAVAVSASVVPIGAAANAAAFTAAVGIAAYLSSRRTEKDSQHLEQQALALAARGRELEAVMDASGDAVFSVDHQGALVLWNHAAADLVADGKPARGRAPVTERGGSLGRMIGDVLQQVREEAEVVQECTFNNFTWQARAVRTGTGAVVTVRDITQERMLHEQEMQRVEQVMKIQRLEDVNAFKTNLLHTASRELNIPLTPIRLQLELLRSNARGPIDARQLRCLEIIDRSTRRLASIVEDLTDVARLENKAMNLDRAPVALDDLLADQIAVMTPSAEEQAVTITIERADHVWVEGDARRLSQAVANLLDNAVKFTPGGVVRVGCKEEGDKVLVWVADNGVGIDPEDLGRAFEPFVRLGSEQRRGTGLGLYIAKGILEGHGGEIGIDSHGPGKGTNVWFRMPAIPPQPHRPSPRSGPIGTQRDMAGAGKGQ